MSKPKDKKTSVFEDLKKKKRGNKSSYSFLWTMNETYKTVEIQEIPNQQKYNRETLLNRSDNLKLAYRNTFKVQENMM